MTVRSSLWLSTPLLLCAGLVGLLAAQALGGMLTPAVGGLGAASALAALLAFGRLSPRGPAA
ncbi:hypothetical protein [uncultured Deinococcus sp.]|uniref:hypothetical protein n=1 Tax=uncultured Deinococcus sp. TaxID=158789 RepID=UPI00258E94B8|nr:hypothetical protein [uncultured Deinococcus sp.]